jgi:hypothetical protein
MIITVQLEQEDYNHMYDIIQNATGAEPTNEEIQAIWDELPDDIRATAIEWGTSDTLFRYNLYAYLTKKK